MKSSWKSNKALRRMYQKYNEEESSEKRKLRIAEQAKRSMKSDKLKEKFESFLKEHDIPYEKEYRFCDRRFRFDYALPYIKTAVEIEGGLYIGGRHITPGGMKKDMEKYNLAAFYGWKVLRFPADELNKWHEFLLKYLEEMEVNPWTA